LDQLPTSNLDNNYFPILSAIIDGITSSYVRGT